LSSYDGERDGSVVPGLLGGKIGRPRELPANSRSVCGLIVDRRFDVK